jgi:DNA-binding transcriptional LysR family regulator
MTTLGQIDLNNLVFFDAVVKTGSFTAAADLLGVAKAKVSIQISRLEKRLDATLLSRTTRQVVLTDAGRALHLECQPLLQGMQDALERIGSGKSTVSGTLRLSTSVNHATRSLAAAITVFARLHPELHIDLRTDDRVVDLVAEGIDLSIRMGWLRDSSLHAVKLGEFEQYVVAAPAYLQRAGIPERPDDLARSEWIALTLLPTPQTWKFSAAGGHTRLVQMKSRIRVDSPDALRAMLLCGAGLSAVDEYNVRADLKAGDLVHVLPGWALPRGGIHAVYPPGRNVPAKVRAFIDFYRDYLDRS